MSRTVVPESIRERGGGSRSFKPEKGIAVKCGYFLQKVVGSGRDGRERWEVVRSAELDLDVQDVGVEAVTRAIEAMRAWADECLAVHLGYCELFNICLATWGEEGFPDVILAEEYRAMLEGEQLRTGHVEDMRPRRAIAPV